jgi:hypothetical protein
MAMNALVKGRVTPIRTGYAHRVPSSHAKYLLAWQYYVWVRFAQEREASEAMKGNPEGRRRQAIL